MTTTFATNTTNTLSSSSSSLQPPSPSEFEDKGPAAACLFVAGMADDTDEAALTALFDRLTARGALKTKLRADRSARRYAFVQLRDVNDAVLVTKLATENQVSLDGRALRVQLAHVQRVVVVCSYLPTLVSTEFLHAFGSAYGAVEQTEAVAGASNVGFIKFTYREDALAFVHSLSANPQCGWSAQIYNKNHHDPAAALFEPRADPANRSVDDAILSALASASVTAGAALTPPLSKNDSGERSPVKPHYQQHHGTRRGPKKSAAAAAAAAPAPLDGEAAAAAAALESDELSSAEKCQVFIGGIDPTIADDSEIKELFARCGEIVSFSLKNNSVEDKCRDSFAFVRYKTADAAATAIRELHGTLVGNKKIRVQPLEPASTKKHRKNRAASEPAPGTSTPPQDAADYAAQNGNNDATPEMVTASIGALRDGDAKKKEPKKKVLKFDTQAPQQQPAQQQQAQQQQQQQPAQQQAQQPNVQQAGFQQAPASPPQQVYSAEQLEQLMLYQQQQYAAHWWYQQQAQAHAAAAYYNAAAQQQQQQRQFR